jgi:hypothetical protein
MRLVRERAKDVTRDHNTWLRGVHRTVVLPGRPFPWRPPHRLIGLLERRAPQPA